MKYHLTLIVAILLAILSPALADPVTDRLDAIEARIRVVEKAVGIPTTKPTQPAIVRADTEAEFKAALLAGAQHIQTAGLELSGSYDCRGALIELLPGGPGWKPAVSLSGEAFLANVAVKTPLSTYNADGRRTGFWKAINIVGKAVTLSNVTIAPDAGFGIHVMQGRLTMESVKATTFSEYFVFQEKDTHTIARWCEVRGGSKAESVWRTSGGTYDISDSLLDNSAGGKAVLRGDSPGTIVNPGGVVRRTKLVGQVGPNPLTEDDGGQMLGIDRWRFAEGWLYQLDYSRRNECIAFARQLFLDGRSPAEIVRATADKFIDGAQLAKVAKGKTKLSDGDIKLTLDYRAAEVGRSSTVLIEDCDIVGGVRLNARVAGTIRRTKITGVGGDAPISGNSQATYPWPTDRVIIGGEQKAPPAVTFDNVTFGGGTSIGLDLRVWPSLRFINGSTYAGVVISRSIPLFNGTPYALAGMVPIRVDNGWLEVNGKSAWVNGGAIAGRFDVIDSRLRELAAGLTTPFVVDIEWQDDIRSIDEATARKNLTQHAKILDILQGSTHQPISTYSWPRTDFYTTWHKGMVDDYRAGRPTTDDAAAVRNAAEYEAAWAKQQAANDLARGYLAEQLDFLLVNIYPVGSESLDAIAVDSSFIRAAIAEARRLAGGKPVIAIYLPYAGDTRQVVSGSRSRAAISTARQLADGVIFWTGNLARADVDRIATAIEGPVE